MRTVTAFAMLAIVGCRLNFDAVGSGTGDGGVDGGSLGDAPADAPLGAFGTPMQLTSLGSSSDDDDPSLTGDQLEIYFTSTRTGGMGADDMWRSTRPDISMTWPAPQPVAELNSTTNDSTPFVSLDGLTILFARGSQGAQNLFVATRTDRLSPWSTPVAVTELNTPASDLYASTTASGLVLVLASTRNGSNVDLFEATRTSTASPWGAPVALTALNDPTANDSSPRLDPSGLVLYFDSDRGSQGRDIYVSTRATLTSPWSPPVRLDELASPQTDSDPSISPDLRTLVFASERTGDFELYQATR